MNLDRYILFFAECENLPREHGDVLVSPRGDLVPLAAMARQLRAGAARNVGHWIALRDFLRTPRLPLSRYAFGVR